MSHFDQVDLAPPDSIFGLVSAFKEDTRQNKVNLVVGVYCNESLTTPAMRCVVKAEKQLAEEALGRNYLPIDGNRGFVNGIGALIFGEKLWANESHRIYGAQTVGGTGALRAAGELIKSYLNESLYVSNPTWANHLGVFKATKLQVKSYPYYDFDTNGLSFEAMIDAIKGMQQGATILLHAVCHNPTGVDLSAEEWNTVCNLIEEKKLFTLFDCAYQGFGKGVEEDAYALRLFLERGLSFMIAFSCSKNFGLYAERTGALFAVTRSESEAKSVGSQIKRIIRVSYSNPPNHGSKVVERILTTDSLRADWIAELHAMRARIAEQRENLTVALERAGHDYGFMRARKGMFSFTGLSKDATQKLKKEKAIYMTGDGRINLAGLSASNLAYVASAIAEVTELSNA